MNITAASPVEIDTEIFRNLQLVWAAQDTQERLLLQLHSLVGDEQVRTGGYGSHAVWQMSHDQVLRTAKLAVEGRTFTGRTFTAYQAWKEQGEIIEVASLAVRTLDKEYFRRGTWTRAYLVDNADGHVHNTITCSTWNKGISATRYHWLTELSGTAETEIVELAGERACTLCFPTAPVDVLKRPSKLEGPAQIAAREAKAAKAAEKAAKAAQAIVIPEYREFGHAREHTFKTTRGATNAIAGELSSLVWYGETHPMAGEWKSNIASIRQALADKGIDYDYDRALAAARKRVVREGGKVEF